MVNPAGAVLRATGLYRPLRRFLARAADPELRAREREIRSDLKRTAKEVAAWGGREMGAQTGRRLGIVSFTNLPLHAKMQALIGKALQGRGYQPVVFTFSGCAFGQQYFDLFGLSQRVEWDRYSPDDSLEAGAARAETAARLLYSLNVPELQRITFHGVHVGKHALSMTCRKQIEGHLNLDAPATQAILAGHLCAAIQSVVAAERYLNTHPLEKLLVRDPGYVPSGAIFETALQRGVDCIVYEQGQRRGTWIFKRYAAQSLGRHPFSLSDETWEVAKKEPWTKGHQEWLDREFAGRYAPDSTDDTRRLHKGKRLASRAAVQQHLGLDPHKKTAVIFAHMAWDAAFFYGTSLFDDYGDWLLRTVRYAAAEGSALNWIVKLHPFNTFKLRREGRNEESEMPALRALGSLPAHVHIMRAGTPLSTQALFDTVDYVLTVNGTVGMEFPCRGIPAVVAGTGRYEGRGFTLEPRTRCEYFALLKRLAEVPPLDAASRELAQRHFMAVMRRQVSLEDVAPMELKDASEAQSDVHDNIRVAPRSWNEFSSAASMQRVAEWMVNSHAADLMETSG